MKAAVIVASFIASFLIQSPAIRCDAANSTDDISLSDFANRTDAEALNQLDLMFPDNYKHLTDAALENVSASNDEVTKKLQELDLTYNVMPTENLLISAPIALVYLGYLLLAESVHGHAFVLSRPKGIGDSVTGTTLGVAILDIRRKIGSTFQDAERSMGEIGAEMRTVPRVVEKVRDIIIKYNKPELLPTRLRPQADKLIQIVDKCAEYATKQAEKFVFVENALADLTLMLKDTQDLAKIEREALEGRLRAHEHHLVNSKALAERMNRTLEQYNSERQQAKKAYDDAIKDIPTGWKAVAMDFIRKIDMTQVLVGIARAVSMAVAPHGAAINMGAGAFGAVGAMNGALAANGGLGGKTVYVAYPRQPPNPSADDGKGNGGKGNVDDDMTSVEDNATDKGSSIGKPKNAPAPPKGGSPKEPEKPKDPTRPPRKPKPVDVAKPGTKDVNSAAVVAPKPSGTRPENPPKQRRALEDALTAGSTDIYGSDSTVQNSIDGWLQGSHRSIDHLKHTGATETDMDGFLATQKVGVDTARAGLQHAESSQYAKQARASLDDVDASLNAYGGNQNSGALFGTIAKSTSTLQALSSALSIQNPALQSTQSSVPGTVTAATSNAGNECYKAELQRKMFQTIDAAYQSQVRRVEDYAQAMNKETMQIQLLAQSSHRQSRIVNASVVAMEGLGRLSIQWKNLALFFHSIARVISRDLKNSAQEFVELINTFVEDFNEDFGDEAAKTSIVNSNRNDLNRCGQKVSVIARVMEAVTSNYVEISQRCLNPILHDLYKFGGDATNGGEKLRALADKGKWAVDEIANRVNANKKRIEGDILVLSKKLDAITYITGPLAEDEELILLEASTRADKAMMT